MAEWIRDHDKQCVSNPDAGFTVFWLNAPTPAELPPRYAVVKDGKGFGVHSGRFEHVRDGAGGPPRVVLAAGGVPIQLATAAWNGFQGVKIPGYRGMNMPSGQCFSSVQQQNDFLTAIKDAMPHIPIAWGGGPDFGYQAVFAPDFQEKIVSGAFLI